MKRYALAAAVAAATLVVAACGSPRNSAGSPPTTSSAASSNSGTSSSPAASAQQSATTSAPPVDPKKYLLSISDLPTGWAVNTNSASSSADPKSCYYNVLNQAPQLLYAKASFNESGNLIQSLIASYQSGPTAWNKIKANLDNCTSFSEQINGYTMTGTMVAVSFPSYGDQSAAYSARLDASGSTFVQAYVLIRKGNWIAVVALSDSANVETALLTSLVDKAVAKMPG
jgi:hypothetical protein